DRAADAVHDRRARPGRAVALEIGRGADLGGPAAGARLRGPVRPHHRPPDPPRREVHALARGQKPARLRHRPAARVELRVGVRRVAVFVGCAIAALLGVVPLAHAYTVPPDNPFVSTPDARGEIYVYGLRNPFRWSFDRLTGDMYVGAVGNGAWEESPRLPVGTIGGANLGCPCREGAAAGPVKC